MLNLRSALFFYLAYFLLINLITSPVIRVTAAAIITINQPEPPKGSKERRAPTGVSATSKVIAVDKRQASGITRFLTVPFWNTV